MEIGFPVLCVDLSLTPGRAAWEWAAGHSPAVSWPSWVHHHFCYRHVAKARGAGGLSYTSRVCGLAHGIYEN